MQTATQQGSELTIEKKLTLLQARAKTLARPLEETEGTGLQLEVAEFHLGEETFALPSTTVREVYPLKGLTPLPCTPSCVLGVINVRGRILPVVDLASVLGIAKQQISEQSSVILMKAGELEAGIVVDLGISIRSLPLATIHPPLTTLANSRARYLQGITHEGVVVLDAAKLLPNIRLNRHEG
jgi:purine-binding chemotaxis protein CheW